MWPTKPSAKTNRSNRTNSGVKAMTRKLRWGFKAEAERVSLALRQQLGLTANDRLDPFALAQLLRVGVRRLDQMEGPGFSAKDVADLMDPTAGFSALTVWRDSRPLIVYNPAHSPARTANDVCHELGHIFHKHPPRPAIGFGGCREWDDRYEDEAVWQAGALLVPRDGAFAMILQGYSILDGAGHFGVSEDLFRWRAHKTGVVRVVGLVRAS
jgi:hypothetical protein